jgi:hypothetical protein
VRPERAPETEGSGSDNSASDEGFERGANDDIPLLPEEMEGLDLGQGNGLSTWVNTTLRRVPWTALLAAAGAGLVLALAGSVLALRAGVIGWENLGGLGAWVLRRRGGLLPSAVSLVYMQFERAARWLGLGVSGAVTPYERAEAFTAALPESRPGVETLTREYVAEQYSPRPADVQSAHQAWQGIRLRVWHDALQAYLLDLLEDAPASGPARTSRLSNLSDQ